MNSIDLSHLRAAIEVARLARQHGNHPFGAILVDQAGLEVLRAENTVLTDRDATGHAETNLIRLASAKYTAAQLHAFTLYSSTEPCAMCSGAIHWSGIGRVVYALAETALYEIVGPSDDHLYLPCREVFAHVKSPIRIDGPCSDLDADARLVHAGFWR